MSLGAIRRLLQAHLDTLAPAWVTVYEGEEGAAPVDGSTTWQRATLLPSRTLAAGFGKDAGARWSGVYQVTPFVPASFGTGALDGRVDALLGHFARGTNLAEGAVRLTLLQPYVAQATVDGGWLSCPVSAPYFAYI